MRLDEEEPPFHLSDIEIDELYTRAYLAGRCLRIGHENQTPLEAAEGAGWKRIRTFSTCLAVEQGAFGVDSDRDFVAVADDANGLWAVNITAESEREPDSL